MEHMNSKHAVKYCVVLVTLVMASLPAVTQALGGRLPRDGIDPRFLGRDDGTVNSIEIDGAVIDCVDIDQQPAVDHPLLKDHVIEMKRPSFDLPESSSSSQRDNGIRTVNLLTVNCPKGTVPVRRTRWYPIKKAGPFQLADIISSSSVHQAKQSRHF